MEIVFLFIKAILIGFAVAVPLGPIGALCIRHALSGKWFCGLSTGLGAAMADAVLAAIAAFGLGFLRSSLLEHSRALQLFGGVFLLFFGGRMIVRTPPHMPHRDLRQRRSRFHVSVKELAEYLREFASGFLLTIVNPAPILAFLGIFVGMRLFERYTLGIDTPYAIFSSIVLVGGVLLGSTLWWLLLATGSVMAREQLSHRMVNTVNRVLGTVVFAFGVVALVELMP